MIVSLCVAAETSMQLSGGRKKINTGKVIEYPGKCVLQEACCIIMPFYLHVFKCYTNLVIMYKGIVKVRHVGTEWWGDDGPAGSLL